MATEWTHVRVRRSTLERLQVYLGRIEAGRNLGFQPLGLRDTDRPTLDDAIVLLLYRDAVARQRRTASKDRRRRGEGRPGLTAHLTERRFGQPHGLPPRPSAAPPTDTGPAPHDAHP